MTIGTSRDSDILLCEAREPGGVFATISLDDLNMMVLRLAERQVSCTVNGNVVTDRYWIKENDEILVEGYRLDVGQVIEKLGEIYPYAVLGIEHKEEDEATDVFDDNVESQALIYGPPPIEHEEDIVFFDEEYQSDLYGPPPFEEK